MSENNSNQPQTSSNAREFVTKLFHVATRMSPVETLSVYAPANALMATAMHAGRSWYDTTFNSSLMALWGTILLLEKDSATTVDEVNALVDRLRVMGGALIVAGTILLHPATSSAVGITDAVPATYLTAVGLQMILCAGAKEVAEAATTALGLPDDATEEDIMDALLSMGYAGSR